jgi:hypothetical protein
MVAAVAVAVLAVVTAAHPLHTSAADIVVSRGAVTVELRVFRDDLELEIGRAAGSRRVAEWAMRAIALSGPACAIPLTYVAHRPAGDMVHIVLRGPPIPRGQCRLRYTAFFGRFRDQVNVVRVRTEQGERTMLFVPGDAAKPMA